MLCGHLLGKGWPLGSVWGVFCEFPIGILGQVWYLIVSIPDLCTFPYLNMNLGANFVLLCTLYYLLHSIGIFRDSLFLQEVNVFFFEKYKLFDKCCKIDR